MSKLKLLWWLKKAKERRSLSSFDSLVAKPAKGSLVMPASGHMIFPFGAEVNTERLGPQSMVWVQSGSIVRVTGNQIAQLNYNGELRTILRA